MAQRPTAQIPGVYHRRLGHLLVTAVSDGYVDPPARTPRAASTAAAADRMVAGGHRPGRGCGSASTMFAIRGAGRTVLVDAGSGTTMGPTCGRLPDNLQRPGSSPATSTPSC